MGQALSMPSEQAAPVRDTTYFISDMHLGARYLPSPREAELKVCRFLRSIAPTAKALYILGDALDYWFEYRTVAPQGFTRFFGALAELADQGVRIVWFKGNHDIWLFDYLRREIGMEVVDGCREEEIDGLRVFLGHGDGVGRLEPGFRFIRWLFRCRLCQKLFAAVHPRWTVPLAYAWSSSNRHFATASPPEFLGMEREPQAVFALDYLKNVDPGVNLFIFGHRHVMANVPLSPSCRLIMLGDWIWHDSYARLRHGKLELLQYVS